MKTLLLIPAYNESESLLGTVEEITNCGFDYIVINDGSTDATLDICHHHGIPVLDLRQNLGIGGAIQAGHKYALENNYDIDVQFDGDGQHDASYIEPLLERIENGCDLAIGSRFLETSDGFQSTKMRRAGIRWISFWIHMFTGKKITDPTSGFRACGGNAIELFAKQYPIDYPEPESIVYALNKTLSVEEVPVQMRERQGGESSISGASSIYYMVKVLLAIMIFSHRRDRG